ncbi:hypothetical protein FMUND_9393 [Fusarium mundagurra]|uniref:Uncharacterized protein n=1 Tax=Fusarium mundagurra TaxID=1567541 RepID=A0A8H6DBR9_9HYPO|nr:hypothetical protein FMUND_9393 [Fusarium mundagurra]
MAVTFPTTLVFRTQICRHLDQLIQQQEQFRQELQQVRSLVDQPAPPSEYNYVGYIHILFSLANTQRLLCPDTALSIFIKNSKCARPSYFIVRNIQRHRAHLQLPYITENEVKKNLERYTNENYVQMALSIGGVPSQVRPFSVLEAIGYSGIKETELAIIIGYEMGAAGYCVHPDFARTEEQLFRLGMGWISVTIEARLRHLLAGDSPTPVQN